MLWKEYKEFVIVGTALVVLLVAALLWSIQQSRVDRVVAVAPNKKTFSYDAYAVVLRDYVDKDGLVDYRRLKADSFDLDDFLGQVAALPDATYGRWSDAERLAFWLNAYNAFVLKAIVSVWPIDPAVGVAIDYPKNSIQQIPGVWTRLKFTAMGEEVTLREIWREVLGKLFHDSRVYLALSAGALSEAPLRQQPYTGAGLDDELDEQVRRVLADPERFRIDREKGVLYLSPLFRDVERLLTVKAEKTSPVAGEESSPAPPAHAALASLLVRYLAAAEAQWLREGKFKIVYLPFNWTLDEQKSEQEPVKSE